MNDIELTVAIAVVLIVIGIMAVRRINRRPDRRRHGKAQDEHTTAPGECAVPERGIGTVLPSTHVGADGELQATSALLKPKRKHTRKQVPKGPGR